MLGGMDKEAFTNRMVSQLSSPWMAYFLQYDPATSLEKVKCQVLAINGEKDVQVSPENLEVIKKALEKGGNKNVLAREYLGLNHLFQKCETGMINEYATIEQTFSPLVLQDISDWIVGK